MKKAALLLAAAVASASAATSPALRAHRHAVVHSAVPPLPAAYNAWRPDPNDLKAVLKDPFSALEKAHGGSHHRKKKGGSAVDDDDFDFELPADMFKPREMKQTFVMDDASTILYKLLDEFGKDSYLQFATKLASDYKLGDAKQATVVQSLRSDLAGFKKEGHDFMLDAARATFPKLSPQQQRQRLVEMLQLMLKNATTAVPPAAAAKKRLHRSSAPPAAAAPAKK
eukprot:TRINITY_DN14841_c0_g1_i1.p1 TRINITY_DN14841_c0_g1~~TRINITY_DN14841_c0_g1_i1.p1  ORF type:complete len:226 (-),score=95.04 TRINITY_DN14841_c0_g1_i1:163-840(-)